MVPDVVCAAMERLGLTASALDCGTRHSADPVLRHLSQMPRVLASQILAELLFARARRDGAGGHRIVKTREQTSRLQPA
jgi:hypothetical protein